MSVETLLQPFQLGNIRLDTRFVYAPLTRCRALEKIPQECMKTYYTQRATPNTLFITEATVISDYSSGYPHTPGIFSDEQINAWKPIVKAVKEKGSTFFCQLWHCGRASHKEYMADGRDPVGPSAVAAGGDNQVYLPKSYKMEAYPPPRALELNEIPEIVEQYVQAARNSLAAGFDGVEIHGANGYLLDQFLKQSSNKRTDEYGGSIENRCRLLLQVTEGIVKEIGSKKVGLRLSPYSTTFLDCYEPDVESTVKLNSYLLEQLNEFDLAYVHIVSARTAGSDDVKDQEDAKSKTLAPFRKAFKGPIIAAGGYLPDTAAEEINSGNADLICFGRWWLSNPDLIERFKTGAPLNKYNRDTFYTQDPVVGYTDYPYLSDIPEGTPTQKHYSGATIFNPPKQEKPEGHEP